MPVRTISIDVPPHVIGVATGRPLRGTPGSCSELEWADAGTWVWSKIRNHGAEFGVFGELAVEALRGLRVDCFGPAETVLLELAVAAVVFSDDGELQAQRGRVVVFAGDAKDGEMIFGFGAIE